MILAFRTDKPEAELYLLKDKKIVAQYTWLAERRLAGELLPKLQKFLKSNKTTFKKLDGVIIFTGEGSFTGLRIGTTVANTLAYSYNIPAISTQGEDWLEVGLQQIVKAKPGNYVVPNYDSEPNITKPTA